MNRGGRQAPVAGYGQQAQQAQQIGNAGYGQNQYAQDPSQVQGDQYGQDQYAAGNIDQEPQDGGYGQQGDDQANRDMSGQQGGQVMNGMNDHEHGDQDQEEAHDGSYNMAAKKKTANALANKTPSKMGKKNQFTPKPQHAHSRFAQDPHHHQTMMNFHKIASEGLSPAHIESFVHIGTFALAHLAKQTGMTAGHEPDEDEEDAQALAQ